MNKKITAIKAVRNPAVKRANIYLNGKFAFSLDNEVVLKEKLKVDQELTSSEVDLLTRSDRFQRCLNSAFHFLSYRPRSESEIRERLRKHGYENEEIDRTVDQLKRLSLIDDVAFAEYWKDNRNSFRPRGQGMLKIELKRKGIETDVIDEVIEDVDDSANAYRAAVNKARTLPVTDYLEFRRKMVGYLQRRGFNYGVINNTVKQVWHEKTGQSQPDTDYAEDVLP